MKRPKITQKMLYFLLGGVVALYVFLCVAVYLFQERLIFFPEHIAEDFRFRFQEPFEEVFLRDDSPDARLHALWFHDAQKPRDRVILYFHGNAGSLIGWGGIAEDFVPLGYDVLIIDYRTYGKSRGRLSQKTFLQDAETALAFVRKHYDEGNITIMGRSLGTGIATYTATRCQPARLILETPYYNFPRLVSHHVRFLPTSLLLRYRFMTNEYMKQVKCPVYIFHGTNDATIPYEHGAELAKMLPPDHLITLPEGTHNDLAMFPLYQQKMRKLLGAP